MATRINDSSPKIPELLEIEDFQEESAPQQQQQIQPEQQQFQQPQVPIDIEVEMEPAETWSQWGLRNLTNLVKEGGQTAFGLATGGNLVSGYKGFKKAAQKKWGPDWDGLYKKIEQEQGQEAAKGVKNLHEMLGMSYDQPSAFDFATFGTPPTSEHAKRATEGVAGLTLGVPEEYWEPRNEEEKISRDYVNRVTGYMMSPQGGVSSFILPIIGLGGKNAAKALGASDFLSEVVGTGLEIGANVFNPYNAEKKIAENFKNINKRISAAGDGNALKLKKAMQDAQEKAFGFGDPTKADDWILKRSEKVLDFIRNEKVNLKDLWDYKTDKLSSHIREFRGDKSKILNFSKDLNNAINETIISATKKVDPSFSTLYKDSNKIYSSMMKGANVANTMENLKDTYGLARILSGGLSGVKWMLKGIAKITGIKYVGQAANVFATSKAGAKFYGKILSDAARNNIQSTSTNLKKMQAVLEKEFPGINEHMDKYE